MEKFFGLKYINSRYIYPEQHCATSTIFYNSRHKTVTMYCYATVAAQYKKVYQISSYNFCRTAPREFQSFSGHLPEQFFNC